MAEHKRKPAARPEAKKPTVKPKSVVRSESAASASQPAAISSSTVMPNLSASDVATGDAAASAVAMPSRRGWFVIGGTVVGLLLVFLAVFAVLIYKYQSDSRIVEIVADIVPYPAEAVNGHFVSYGDYLFEVNSIKHYYLSQTDASGKPTIDFTTSSGKQKLKALQTQELQQLQQESVIQQLASHYKVSVSSSDVQAQVDSITKSAGGTAKVKDVLTKYYGWSIADLEKKIRQQLLEQKVSDAVTADPTLNAAAKTKAEGILQKVKAGGDFATLAKQYSQDSSAANGGDLGFFTKSQMVAPFANAAFSLKPGQVYPTVVQSQYGYHVIKVNAVQGSQVDASQILIKGVDFNTYLQQQVSKAKIHQYIHP